MCYADAYSSGEDASERTYILTLSCPNRQGVAYAVSSYLFTAGCSIVESQQFSDSTGLFFMRVVFSAGLTEDAEKDMAKLRADFTEIADRFSVQVEWNIHPADQKMRMLIMVSKFGHCLNDLLFRSRTLPVKIVAVVSNHRDFEELVNSYGIPFHHIPVTKDTKPEAEAQLLSLIESADVETVVLARYMQVLSHDLCTRLASRIINIHHSLLPSFKGAKPYHQAHARGVKLIGATAHYVTADLDEGPIIEQAVERVGHGLAPDQLVAVGRDVECQVLARAVAWHSEHRVLLNGRRTVVFV